MKLPHIFQMAEILVDVGDLIPAGDDFFEDMGGHLLRIDMVPSYFEHYLEHASPDDRKDALERLKDG